MFNLSLDRLLLLIPVILLSLTVHEFSHAWAAYKLGDDTAARQGRLSLNPLVHLDIVGSILILLAGFGWAKPVPVNALNFKDPQRGILLVAIAGPISNVLMALIAALILRYVGLDIGTSVAPMMVAFKKFLYIGITINLALAVFNMIPLPPLDGSRVVYGLLPRDKAHAYSKIEPYGIFILFGIFMFGGNLLGNFIWYPVDVLSRLFLGL